MILYSAVSKLNLLQNLLAYIISKIHIYHKLPQQMGGQVWFYVYIHIPPCIRFILSPTLLMLGLLIWLVSAIEMWMGFPGRTLKNQCVVLFPFFIRWEMFHIEAALPAKLVVHVSWMWKRKKGEYLWSGLNCGRLYYCLKISSAFP